MHLRDVVVRFSIGVASFGICVANSVIGARRVGCCWVVHSVAGVAFGRMSTTAPISILDAASTFPGSLLGPLNIFRVPPGIPFNDAILGQVLTFSISVPIPPVPTCAHDGRRPAQERPAGMDLIFRVEVDTNSLPTEGPVEVHRMQRNGLILPSEFRDMPPLTASKSLQDEEEDESKSDIVEEVEAQ